MQGDFERASLVDGALQRMVETQSKAVKAAVDMAVSVLGVNGDWKIVLRKSSAIEHSLCGFLSNFFFFSILLFLLQFAASVAVSV